MDGLGEQRLDCETPPVGDFIDDLHEKAIQTSIQVVTAMQAEGSSIEAFDQMTGLHRLLGVIDTSADFTRVAYEVSREELAKITEKVEIDALSKYVSSLFTEAEVTMAALALIMTEFSILHEMDLEATRRITADGRTVKAMLARIAGNISRASNATDPI